MTIRIQKILIGILLSLSFFGFQSYGADKNLGLGFILGNPTALSVKWLSSEESALDFQASLSEKDYLVLWGDYLFQYPGFFGNANKFARRLTPYVGVGPLIALGTKNDHDKGDFFDERDDDFALGLRVPFGMEWFWDRVPLAVGLELAPGVIVAPATRGIVQGGLSFRFYF